MIDATQNNRGFAVVALDNPKTDINIATVLRAVGVYRAAMAVVSGKRYKRHSADTMAAYRHTPLLHVEDVFDAIPFDCVPIAVDLVPSAVSLPMFTHPERAFYIFGAEDATLDDRIISRCQQTIYVPTNGCMNLAMAVNVVLYDRLAKQAYR